MLRFNKYDTTACEWGRQDGPVQGDGASQDGLQWVQQWQIFGNRS